VLNTAAGKSCVLVALKVEVDLWELTNIFMVFFCGSCNEPDTESMLMDFGNLGVVLRQRKCGAILVTSYMHARGYFLL